MTGISKLARRCLRAQGWRWSKGWKWATGHKRKDGRRYQLTTKRGAGAVMHRNWVIPAYVQLVTGDSPEEINARIEKTGEWLKSLVAGPAAKKVQS